MFFQIFKKPQTWSDPSMQTSTAECLDQPNPSQPPGPDIYSSGPDVQALEPDYKSSEPYAEASGPDDKSWGADDQACGPDDQASGPDDPSILDIPAWLEEVLGVPLEELEAGSDDLGVPQVLLRLLEPTRGSEKRRRLTACVPQTRRHPPPCWSCCSPGCPGPSCPTQWLGCCSGSSTVSTLGLQFITMESSCDVTIAEYGALHPSLCNSRFRRALHQVRTTELPSEYLPLPQLPPGHHRVLQAVFRHLHLLCCGDSHRGRSPPPHHPFVLQTPALPLVPIQLYVI